jgi:hypothetical protein
MTRFNSLFKIPQKWDNGIVTGFIVLPHDNENQNGWGEPFKDEFGDPLPGGTPDGINSRRLIGITDDWKKKWGKKSQIAGAIDWKGDWINPYNQEDNQEKRYCLSWNGHVSRYWNPTSENGNPEYIYEDDIESQSNEIYIGGQILTVAPQPVLGAALYTDNNDNLRIVAICKEAEIDVAYTMPIQRPQKYEEITLDWKEGQVLKWDFAASFELQESGDTVALFAETPWFFNTEGTSARTMRRSQKTYIDEGGTERVDDVWIEYTFNISTFSNRGIFNNLGFDDKNIPFIYTESIEKTHPEWTDLEPDGVGLYHDWQEDHVISNIDLTGYVKVAVDWSFEKEAWVYAWIKYVISRRHAQYFTVGVDPPVLEVPPDPTNYSNIGLHDGKRYPQSSDKSEGDHTETEWISINEVVTLEFGKKYNEIDYSFIIGWGFVGSDSFITGQPYSQRGETQQKNNNLRYVDSFDVWIHHVDLRTKLISGYVNYTSAQKIGNDMSYTESHKEWSGVGEQMPFTGGYLFMQHDTPVSIYSSSEYFIGFSRAAMETWPEEYTDSYTRTNYTGALSTDNDNEEIFAPSFKDFYVNDVFTVPANAISPPETERFEKRVIMDYLMATPYRGRNNRIGIFCSTESDEYITNYEFFDEAIGNIGVAELLLPLKEIKEVTGVSKNYPGGVI